MNEITLSENLAQIELEINHHKQIAGQSIWEIGRRLNHVKEHDLAHGQFTQWIEKIGLNYSEANKMMRVASELPNLSTLRDLGTSALYLIATLPDEEKAQQLERIQEGDSPTVRELQEVKRQLNLAESDLSALQEKNEALAEQALQNVQPKIIEKEVVREVVPDDYEATKKLNSTLLDRNKELQQTVEDALEHEEYLKKQLSKHLAEREAVDAKSAKYDELTEAIKQSEGQLNDYQKKIGAYKNLLSFLRKGNEMLLHMGGLLYVDEKRVLESSPAMQSEFEDLRAGVNRLADDMNKFVNHTEILEGELV